MGDISWIFVQLKDKRCFFLYRITTRVRKLLMLIPTDPAINENLDFISNSRVSICL